MKTRHRLALGLSTAGLAGLVLGAVPAGAHIHAEPHEVPAGASSIVSFTTGHGCDGSPTKAVRVQIPEGFFNAKPQPKAGWILETITGPYEKTYDNHGTVITEGVREIIWSGGNLPSGWYGEFVFRGTFADSLAEGDFVFPTVQECVGGDSESWIQIPRRDEPDAELDYPAPSVVLTAAVGAERLAIHLHAQTFFVQGNCGTVTEGRGSDVLRWCLDAVSAERSP